MRAVILAGGKGTRLRPYTTLIPKPLVPMGNEMPILEIILRQLATAGFNHVTITVNHLANLIQAFFGDGSKFGLKIDYSLEDKPLSTIAPLTLIPDLPENFLVMNGDILCSLDYRKLYEYHIDREHQVTVAVNKREAKIDFGVLHFDANNMITGFQEKPVLHYEVSMGVYCINRKVVETLQPDRPYGFDNLMNDGLKSSARHGVMPFEGFWYDIGRPEDYDFCNENYDELKKQLGL